MKKEIILILYLTVIAGLLISNTTQAQHVHHQHNHADETGHVMSAISSPAGVMGDHVHGKGSWMFSYMHMGMQMGGLYEGRSEISSMTLMEQYDMTPEDMFMQMHMLGVMYAVSDRFTFMAMVPFLQKEMGHNRMGHHQHHGTMSSSGLGDIELSVITPLYSKNSRRLILNSGVTLPTGSVNVSSTDGMGMDSRMSYGMQLGSGTPDIHGMITYSGQADKWKIGTQLGGVLRLGTNSEQYRQGNSIEHSVWAGRNVLAPLTATVRLQTNWQDHIYGSDRNINPEIMPTADPYCYGGLRSRLMGGLNLRLASFLPVSGTLGFEAGLPVYQNLNGPQMGEKWTILSALKISI